MKILIIGGNRFFGKRLSRLLIDGGNQVTLLNRGRLDDGLGSGVERLRCDRTNPEQLRDVVSGRFWDVVCDQVCYEAKEARAAVQIFAGKTAHYVFTSSQSVYGFGPDLHESEFTPGSHAFSQDALTSREYAEAKRQCEAVFTRASHFPVTMVRLPIVMGAEDYTNRLRFHVQKVQNREPIYFPDLQAKNSFIHSDDAASALVFLAHKTPVGPLNVASAEPISVAEIMAEVERVTGETAIYARTPNDVNHSPYGIERDRWMNTDRSRELGFQATPIRSWLQDVIRS